MKYSRLGRFEFFLVVACVLFIGTSLRAEPLAMVHSGSIKEKLSLDISLLHYRGMESAAEDSTIFSPTLFFKLSERTRWGITQTMTKLYLVDPGQKEVQSADTLFSYQHLFWRDVWGLNWTLKAQATLPISEYSRDHEVLTKPYLGIVWVKGFFDQKLNVSLNPYARYYVNKFTTTATEAGAGGGDPLRRSDLGVVGTVSLSLARGISFLASLQYQENYYEGIGKKNRDTVNADKLPLSHNYSFDIEAAVQVSRWWSVIVGYGQADQVERSGGLQMVAYDPVATQVFLGTNYTF